MLKGFFKGLIRLPITIGKFIWSILVLIYTLIFKFLTTLIYLIGVVFVWISKMFYHLFIAVIKFSAGIFRIIARFFIPKSTKA